MISKRQDCRGNHNPYYSLSLPKMPTPIRCELADNLSYSNLFTCGIFGRSKESCHSSHNHNIECKDNKYL